MSKWRYTFAAASLLILFVTADSRAQTAVQPSGSGMAGDPYLIVTVNNLAWLQATANDTAWSRYYVQTADINASPTTSWNAGQGFSPIGSQAMSFTGTYDGQGHTIDGLFIARSTTDNVGMFGLVSDATIRNIRLTNVNITGQNDVGGLVGDCTGSGSASIDSCSTTGIVTGAGSQETGGLVGMGTASSTIANCYSTATVNGSNLVGGLLGHNDQGTVVRNSYSAGSVNGSGSGIGGLVGYNTFTVPAAAQIINSYTACTLTGTGTSQVGGFVGGNSGTISNSFWNTDSSGSTGIGAGSSSGATGETSAQMKTLSTFTTAGWDFVLETANGINDYWDMDTTNKVINNGYPFLHWENGGVSVLPVEMSSFAISSNQSSAELKWTTATEANTNGWQIERQDGSATWTYVGFIRGAGMSSSPRQYSFLDRDLRAGSYSYRLKQIDNNGSAHYSKTVSIEIGTAPHVFTLSQNYPNPFNPTTTIEFTLPSDGRVVMKVYDILGREVATLLDEDRKAGVYQQAVFDASRFTSGVYFVRVEFGGKQLLKKMLLVK